MPALGSAPGARLRQGGLHLRVDLEVLRQEINPLGFLGTGGGVVRVAAAEVQHRAHNTMSAAMDAWRTRRWRKGPARPGPLP